MRLLVAPDGGNVRAVALCEPAEPAVPVLLKSLVGVLLACFELKREGVEHRQRQ